MPDAGYQYVVGTQSSAPGVVAYFPSGTIPSQTWSCIGNPSLLQTGQSSVGLSAASGVFICHSGSVTTTMTAGKLTVAVNNLTLDFLAGGDGGAPPTTILSARLTCP